MKIVKMSQSLKIDSDTHKCIQAGSLDFGQWLKMHEMSRRYYDPNGISPTIHTCGGGARTKDN